MALNNDVIGVPPIEDWQIITLQNGWTPEATVTAYNGLAASPRFYKDPCDRVFLGGRMKGGSATLPAFILPIGYRPGFTFRVPCSRSDGGVLGIAHIFLFADGRLIPDATASGWLALESISFRAEWSGDLL